MMTIDGTNISTYGLHLSYVNDHLNKPARKKILNETQFGANDIKFESKEPTIILVGTYSSEANLYTNIEAFKTKIESSIKHTFILTGHSVTFTGVVINGIKIETIRTFAKVTFKVTIEE